MKVEFHFLFYLFWKNWKETYVITVLVFFVYSSHQIFVTRFMISRYSPCVCVSPKYLVFSVQSVS
jgi:hypothetical protein